MVDVTVGKAQVNTTGRHPGAAQGLGHCRAGPSGHDVLFDCDQQVVTAGEVQDQIEIQGLDETHVGQRRIQGLCRRDTGRHPAAEGEQGYTPSAAADLALTGEGAIDASTFMGKGAGQIAQCCRALKIRCIGLAGAVVSPARARHCFTDVRALTDLTSVRQAQAQQGGASGEGLEALRAGRLRIQLEEGLGDLCGMKAVVERFGTRVSAYLVLEGMSLGQVYHRGLGVQRFRITVQAPGGHSWANYGRPSAIHRLARLITRLESLPVPAAPRSSLNVGVIAGGTSVNTIAAQAHLELDLRSEAVSALADLVAQVEQLVAESSQPEEGVTCRAEVIGLRPAGGMAADHPLVMLAMNCLREQGISPALRIGSTDANIPLSQGLPAVCVGLTTGSGAHTLRETIQTAPLGSGLGQLLALAQGAFQLSQP